MPRPARKIWVPRTYSRRRHRSWMVSMTLATGGWAGWWIALVVGKLAPEAVGGIVVAASVIGALLAFPGLLMAGLALRARRTWILFVLVPVFANVTLLVMPWLATGVLGGEAGAR